MKNMFFVVVMLIVSVTTNANAQSEYRAFYDHPGTITTQEQFTNSLTVLLTGNGANWHHNAKKIYLDFFSIQYPGESVETILNGTTYVSVEGKLLPEVGRIHKVTGALSNFQRLGRKNEFAAVYRGKPWSLSGCGNTPSKPIPAAPIMLAKGNGEEIDDYGLIASNNNTVTTPSRETTVQPIIINNVIPAPVAAPAPAAETKIIYVGYGNGVQQQQQLVQQPIQYAQQPAPQYAPAPQYVYNEQQGPQELVIRQRRDFVDYANLALGAANTWFNGVNTYRGMRFENQGMTTSNTYRPSGPRVVDQRDYPRGGPVRIANPRQDGSGYFPNYGNNSNYAGLGGGNFATDRGGSIEVDRRYTW